VLGIANDVRGYFQKEKIRNVTPKVKNISLLKKMKPEASDSASLAT
jgi:hypothetical protein